jgi:hypothetical protein
MTKKKDLLGFKNLAGLREKQMNPSWIDLSMNWNLNNKITRFGNK